MPVNNPIAKSKREFQYKKIELKKLESSTHRRFSEIGKVLDALLKQKQQQENQHNRRRIGFKQGDP